MLKTGTSSEPIKHDNINIRAKYFKLTVSSIVFGFSSMLLELFHCNCSVFYVIKYEFTQVNWIVSSLQPSHSRFFLIKQSLQ